MKMIVFSVLDKAVGAFLPPFYCRSQGEALRSFAEAANDPKRFQKYASDYVLMRLGEYDDGSGLFSCGEPIRVVSALECLVESEVVIPPGLNGSALGPRADSY